MAGCFTDTLFDAVQRIQESCLDGLFCFRNAPVPIDKVCVGKPIQLSVQIRYKVIEAIGQQKKPSLGADLALF